MKRKYKIVVIYYRSKLKIDNVDLMFKHEIMIHKDIDWGQVCLSMKIAEMDDRSVSWYRKLESPRAVDANFKWHIPRDNFEFIASSRQTRYIYSNSQSYNTG